jgi:predicted dehydrogenase
MADRRDFLLTTAGAAMGGRAVSLPSPLAEPAGLRGSTPIRADEPVRIGVIGTGGMGTGHIEALVAIAKDARANLQVVAMSDVCRPRLEEAKAKAEAVQGAGTVTTYYADWRGLLAQPDLHGVLIATPEHWHAPMAEAAVAAGKSVYLEKPMTLRLPEALRLLKLVRDHPQAQINVGTQYVMSPGYGKVKELIAAGAIGKPVWSQTSYCRNSKDGEWLYYAIDPAWKPGDNIDWKQWCGPLGEVAWSPDIYARWRRYRRYSTGIIGDLLVHQMTPLIMALDLGWPTRVVASGGHYVDKAMENHDQVNLNIEFENEHTMVVAGSTANEVGLETVIRGHKANLYVGGRQVTLRPERLYADEVDEQTFEGEDLGDDQDQLRIHWINATRNKTPVASPVELGAKVMVAVDLATRSLWEGAAFGFDPKSMKVRKL